MRGGGEGFGRLPERTPRLPRQAEAIDRGAELLPEGRASSARHAAAERSSDPRLGGGSVCAESRGFECETLP